MAEIEMERKPRRNVWVWVAAAVLVVVLAVGAWYLFAGDAAQFDTTPTAERPGATEPYETVPGEDPYGQRPGVTDPYAEDREARDPLETPEETRRP
jgi:hypothetical protein